MNDKFKLGEWVTINAKFVKHKDWFRVEWQRDKCTKPIQGMYIGSRNVYDGKIYRSEEENGFTQTKCHRVLLFILNGRSNPIHVLPEDAETWDIPF